MYCGKCGKILEDEKDGDTFIKIMQKHFDQCEEDVDKNFNPFCSNCGEKMRRVDEYMFMCPCTPGVSLMVG